MVELQEEKVKTVAEVVTEESLEEVEVANSEMVVDFAEVVVAEVETENIHS